MKDIYLLVKVHDNKELDRLLRSWKILGWPSHISMNLDKDYEYGETYISMEFGHPYFNAIFNLGDFEIEDLVQLKLDLSFKKDEFLKLGLDITKFELGVYVENY